jgi:hypothetical protein
VNLESPQEKEIHDERVFIRLLPLANDYDITIAPILGRKRRGQPIRSKAMFSYRIQEERIPESSVEKVA